MIYSISAPEHGVIVSITAWSIKEVLCSYNSDRTQHLVGYICGEGAGRVTSAIFAFDKEKMIIQTSSGRLYQLVGDPGWHDDAQYVWEYWKSVNDASDEVDVTIILLNKKE